MSAESPAPADITLRPVGPDDYEFLLCVYGTTRAEEMAMVPWTVEQQHGFIQSQFNAQQDHYRKHYPTGSHCIILVGERQVGRLYVARLDQEIRIIDITLLQKERNLGVGSYLLKQLLEEAKLAEKIVRIYVEQFNPSLRLFERLGFSSSQQHGVHSLMEWHPEGNPKDKGD